VNGTFSTIAPCTIPAKGRAVSLVGRYIREEIEKLGLTQAAFAKRCGIEYEALQGFLKGNRLPTTVMSHTIGTALGIHWTIVAALVLRDNGIDPGPIPTRTGLRKHTPRYSDHRSRGHEDSGLGSAAHLDRLARAVRDGTDQLGHAWQELDQIMAANEPQAARSEQAKLKVAASLTLKGMWLNEQLVGSHERALRILDRARNEASELGDLGAETLLYALWTTALHYRKQAERWGEPEQNLRLAQEYLDEALGIAVTSDRLAGYRLLCLGEGAKIPLGRVNGQTDFNSLIQEGNELLLQLTKRGFSNRDDHSLGMPCIDEYAASLFLDVTLRGYARFSRSASRGEVLAAERRARQLGDGLALVQDGVTMNLSVGPLLLNGTAEDELAGVERISDAIRFAKTHDYKWQLRSAKEVLRRVKVPLILQGACWACGPRKSFTITDRSDGYVCSGCDALVISLNPDSLAYGSKRSGPSSRMPTNSK